MNVSVNGDPIEVSSACTIRQLLQQLEIRTNAVAVEVNLDLVPRDRHEHHELCEGDQLEVVTLVGGG